jgi:enamine deaminase RidA (YjgF/YER057c/UK114 family)
MMMIAGVILSLLAGLQESGLEYLEPEASSGTSKAVVVRGMALAHTSQLFPVDETGQLVAASDADRQIERVFERLSLALQEVDSSLDRTVRLHVYAARTEVADRVRQAMARRFRDQAKPAATLVIGQLALPGALVAMDAVAACPPREGFRRVRSKALGGLPGTTQVSILPAGPAVFISGLAEKGTTLAEATRNTLEGLRKSLVQFGLRDEQVVQVKAFFRSISDAALVEKEIANFYGNRDVPPIVLVEWTLDPPIEIELVAAGTPSPAGVEPLRFLTPPGVEASPYYSRIVWVDRGRLVYVSGLTSTGDPEAQVRGVFASIQEILRKTGVDFNHLVKGTYYVTDDPTTIQLKKVRGELYAPARPPGASKAGVRGVGIEGRSVMIDMIGVCPP